MVFDCVMYIPVVFLFRSMPNSCAAAAAMDFFFAISIAFSLNLTYMPCASPSHRSTTTLHVLQSKHLWAFNRDGRLLTTEELLPWVFKQDGCLIKEGF